MNGQPKKQIVYDEVDISFLQEVYNLRFNQKKPLAFATHKLFLSPEDFEKWKEGNWNREEAMNELIQESEKSASNCLLATFGSPLVGVFPASGKERLR